MHGQHFAAAPQVYVRPYALRFDFRSGIAMCLLGTDVHGMQSRPSQFACWGRAIMQCRSALV